MPTIAKKRLRVEPVASDQPADCPCCDGAAGIVQGFVYEGETPFAAYVAGISGLLRGGKPLIALVAGDWGADSTLDDRRTIVFRGEQRGGVLTLRTTTDNPLFWPDFPGLGRRLAKPDVALAGDLKALATLIIAKDRRMSFMVAHGGRSAPSLVADSPSR